MLKAQIHSKLPTHIIELEDVLTSDVFSFFLYSNRCVFLYEFLIRNGLSVSTLEAENADFLFWPRYHEATEPDVVIITGGYYILVEAKFNSDFGKGSDKTKPQLLREVNSGIIEAQSLGKQFVLLAITKDPFNRKEKFMSIPAVHHPLVKWTNWQSISSLLIEILATNKIIGANDRLFAEDLLLTLDKKNLRNYISLIKVLGHSKTIKSVNRVFLQAETVIYRGGFIGYLNSLIISEKIKPTTSVFLSDTENSYFTSCLSMRRINSTEGCIYFNKE